MTVEISVLVASLLLSAFFSGMEIAFVSSNKIRLEIQKTQAKSFGSLLKSITKSPSRFIVSMLVGNNIALVVYGIYAGELIVQELFPVYKSYASLPLCLLYTSDAADDTPCVDLGGRRIIKKKKQPTTP